MLKLAMVNILNPGLICDDPNFSGSFRFMKMVNIKL